MKETNAAKEHKVAAIFEAWDDDWDNPEDRYMDYRIEFDGQRYGRLFKRRCDASRFAGQSAEIVEHWYPI